MGNCLETKKEDKKEEEEKKERKKSKKSALEGKLGIFPCSFVVPIPKKGAPFLSKHALLSYSPLFPPL